METLLARKMWATLEPTAAMIFFAREAFDAWERLGFPHRGMGYFASRAAPMGRVSGPVVAASFYNFNPDLVERFIPAAWDLAEPSTVLQARFDAAGAALRRYLGDAVDSEDMRWAAEVVERAAAACPQRGRTLFAAHAAIAPPDAPHLRLWYGLLLLREFRGDGHVAALLSADVAGIDALVSYDATGQAPFDTEFFRRSRGWTREQWDVARDRLLERGWVADDGTLTDVGQQAREAIEADTDRMAMAPWRAIGQQDADRLRATVRPWSRAIVDAGGLG
ncbi:hypothetical protein BH23ACT10_BH23ACT10_30290 [soil metagenome]